jgi:carbon-monoxide dehydrogenase small subunit
MDPIQDTFYRTFAAQCGYCTPGMILAAKALLERNPDPTRLEIVNAISGNYCRCTGYEPIVQAILESARSAIEMTAEGGSTNGRN